MDNNLLHASGIFPADKIEKRIYLALYHVRLYLANQMMIETKIPKMKTHSIYPVAVEDLDIHYKPSMPLFWLILM